MQPLALLVTEKIEKAGKHLGLRVSWKTFEEKLLRGMSTNIVMQPETE